MSSSYFKQKISRAWCLSLVILALFVPPAYSVGTAQPSLVQVAGSHGRLGNLDGPIQQAMWASGPLHLARDGDALLVADEEGATVRKIDAAGNVTTIAGQSGTMNSLDGSRIEARFAYPTYMVKASNGLIYVAEKFSSYIRVIHPDGQVSTLTLDGTQGYSDSDKQSNEGLPSVVKALAFDAQGKLWVITEGGALFIIDQEGSVKNWVPETSGPNWVDIRVDIRGQLWGMTQDSIYRIYPNRFKKVLTIKPRDATSSPTPQVLALRAFAIDDQDVIYIASETKVWKYEPNGSLKSLFKVTKLEQAVPLQGLSIEDIEINDKDLFISSQGAIHRWSEKEKAFEPYTVRGDSSDKTRSEGCESFADRCMTISGAVLMQRDGSVLMTDQDSNRIRRWTAQRTIENWIGSSNTNTAQQADKKKAFRFVSPTDMVQDSAGNVYVIDGKNALIQRVAPDGQVTVLAGYGESSNREDGIGRNALFWQPRYLSLDEKKGVLYILDNSSDKKNGGTVIRSLNLSTLAVRSLNNLFLKGALPSELDSENLCCARANYDDIAVGAGGDLYVLTDRFRDPRILRIKPETGEVEIFFAAAKNPSKTDFFRQWAQAKNQMEKERLDNRMFFCHWLWCSPERIEADAHGAVYVTDRGNHTVVRINSDGTAGVIAGQLGQRGNQEGSLPGSLSGPGELSWTPNGDLLIATDGNGIVLLRQPQQARFTATIPRFDPELSTPIPSPQ